MTDVFIPYLSINCICSNLEVQPLFSVRVNYYLDFVYLLLTLQKIVTPAGNESHSNVFIVVVAFNLFQNF
jgi:hypothetical protein